MSPGSGRSGRRHHPSSSAPSWRRRWRRSRPAHHLRVARRYLRRHRKPVRIATVIAGALAVTGVLWILITALLARQATQDLVDRLQKVRTLVAEGQVEQAREVARTIPSVADRAHDLTTGPAWWVAAHVPYLGRPLEVARGTAAAGAQVGSQAVPRLMKVAAALDPGRLRVSGNQLDLAPLEQARPSLQAAAREIDAAARAVQRLPNDSWLGSVEGGRQKFARDLAVVRGYVDAAARVANALPEMLGADGPRTYFVGLQNEAELRGTGGLPGAFAIARADHGKLTFSRFESDAALMPPTPNHAIDTGLDFGRDYEAAYGTSLPTTTFVDSNVSPHFPYAARIWQAMWRRVSGQRVDGVLALDPTALSYFLAATGPARLEHGGTIDAANVVTLTQRDEYSIFNDNTQRKQFIVSVLKAAAHKVTSGAGSGLAILQAASLAGRQQRLLAWSDDPVIEKQIEQTSFAGALPAANRPLAGLIVNNAAAGKLDFYLTRSLAYERTGCGTTRDVLVTIKLANHAPATGLPAYVTTRLDHDPPPDVQPGDNRAIVDYYATAGAQLESVTVNGQLTTANLLQDLGHPIYRLDLELPRGQTQTIVLHLREQAGKGSPIIWRQPGVSPLAVQRYDQKCG